MFELLISLIDDPKFKSAVNPKHKIVKPNEKVIHEGKLHNNFYIIKKGQLRVVASGDAENKQLRPGLADLVTNDVFGEFTIFDKLPASADVVAISESEIIEININSFLQFLSDNPDIGYKVMVDMLQVLVKRLRHTNKTTVKLLSWGIKAHGIDKE